MREITKEEQQLFDAFQDYCEKNIELFKRKQLDYGPKNIAEFGEIGVLIRLNDKLQRLIHLITSNLEPTNESIEDSYMDISIYAIIALLCRHDKWPGAKKFRIVRVDENG